MIGKIIINFKESLLGQYTKTLTELMPKKVAIALFLMVLISLIEGISLLLLVPLLQLVGLDVGQGSLGQIAVIVSEFFAYYRFTTYFSISFDYLCVSDKLHCNIN